MTHPLTDQRSRTDLIAELYDRHATGLFAYCADQLGDPVSAGYALVAVLSSVPAQAPPRAALYAFARREIQRRDIVYAPPVVDPLNDPASALVERTLRELRPHQREVLLLCEVCGLTRAELAWVLDVAPDTAEELAISAAHRFRVTLSTALASTGARVPGPIADVYGALGVAPLRDVLCRLPWPAPPASLRVHLAGSRTATAAPLFVKPLWPVPPRWPQPLTESDHRTATGIFPTELLTPPARPGDHEATTAPMPRLRDGHLPDTLPRAPLFTPTTGTPSSPPSSFTGGPSAAAFATTSADPFAPSADPFSPAADPFAGASAADPFGSASVRDAVTGAGSRGDERQGWREGLPPRPRVRDGLPPKTGFLLSAPVPADVLDDPPTDVIPAIELPSPGDVLVHSSRKDAPEPFSAFQPYTGRPSRPADEPVYRLPMPADILAAGDPEAPGASEADLALPVKPLVEPAVEFRSEGAPTSTSPRPRRTQRPTPGARGAGRSKKRPRKQRKHHDWAWELAGFLICLLIAMLVFFSVPVIGSP